MSEPAWSEFEVTSNMDEWIYVRHEPCGRWSPHDRTALNLQEAMDWARDHDCPRGKNT